MKGSRCGADTLVYLMHRFPDKNKGTEFRQQTIIPLVKEHGGSILYSGSIEMTFCGSENWDSIVLAYFPDCKTRNAFIDQLKLKERSLHSLYKSRESEHGNSSDQEDQFECYIATGQPQSPMAGFSFKYITGKWLHCLTGNIRNGYEKTFSENDYEFEEYIPEQYRHLLPTESQRAEFERKLSERRPFVMINLLDLHEPSGEVEYTKYAMSTTLFSLPIVGARVVYQAAFYSGEWNCASLVRYPEGAHSINKLESLDNYRKGCYYRCLALRRTLMLISIQDPKPFSTNSRDNSIDV